MSVSFSTTTRYDPAEPCVICSDLLGKAKVVAHNLDGVTAKFHEMHEQCIKQWVTMGYNRPKLPHVPKKSASCFSFVTDRPNESSNTRKNRPNRDSISLSSSNASSDVRTRRYRRENHNGHNTRYR